MGGTGETRSINTASDFFGDIFRNAALGALPPDCLTERAHGAHRVRPEDRHGKKSAKLSGCEGARKGRRRELTAHGHSPGYEEQL